MNTIAQRFRAASLMFAFVMGMVSLAPRTQAATSAAVTLNFTGTYLASTCNVVGAEDQTVTLPTIATQSLSTPGQSAGTTVFSIPIQCDSGVTGARIYFEGGSTVNGATGNLIPQPVAGQTSARNVEVALQNLDGTPIKVGDRTTMPTWSIAATGPTTTRFIASYYATGASTPGVVQTYVTYVIEIP
jgi:major type 1 subunit fimbrin (pilin)